MLDWIRHHESWLAWLAVASAVTLVASALLIPWLIARLPADYFSRAHAHTLWGDRHPLARIGLLVAKNLLGVVLLLLGVLMLVLPGQGILTILAGIAMIDFPGRHRLVQWIAEREPVMKALNWLRRKASRPDFERPPARS